MANLDEHVKKMYNSNLASQKEQLSQDYTKADSDLTAEQSKGQKATDANLNRTAVESRTAAMNNNEYYAAAGLSSGAKAQARLSQENQTQANMTALRTQQQETDADIERRRSVLAQEYASAIRQAQADNDFKMAETLFANAQREDDQLHDERMLDKQQNWQSSESEKDRTWQRTENQTQRDWQSSESEKDRTWQRTENQTQRDWQSEEARKGWVRDAQDHYRDPSDWEVARYIADSTGDFTYVGQYLGMSDTEVNNLSGGEPEAAGLSDEVNGMYTELKATNTQPAYSERAMNIVKTMPNEQASQWWNKGYPDYKGYLKTNIDAKRRQGELTNEETMWLLQYYHLY